MKAEELQALKDLIDLLNIKGAVVTVTETEKGFVTLSERHMTVLMAGLLLLGVVAA